MISFTKILHPKTCVHAVVYGKDGRRRGKYVVPKNGTITLGSEMHTIEIDSPRYMVGKIPGFTFIEGRNKPIDVAKNWSEKDNTHPADIKTTLNSAFLRQIVNAQNNTVDRKIMIVAAISIVGLLVLGYFMFTQMQAIKDMINALWNNIQNMNGGA